MPILPVHIRGTHALWPRGSAVPKMGSVEVRIGRPITPKRNPDVDISTALSDLTLEVREAVVSLAAAP